ncbi:unnamed protein product, partial [Ectocarpus sp. 12 AP-2014]
SYSSGGCNKCGCQHETKATPIELIYTPPTLPCSHHSRGLRRFRSDSDSALRRAEFPTQIRERPRLQEAHLLARRLRRTRLAAGPLPHKDVLTYPPEVLSP